jgi:outer membrane protein OmpA-like peptidoglycan-associated protein
MRFTLSLFLILTAFSLKAQSDTTCQLTVLVFDTATNFALTANIEVYDYSSESHDTVYQKDSISDLTEELNMHTNFGIGAFAHGYHYQSISYTSGEANSHDTLKVYLAAIDQMIFSALPIIYFGPYDYGIPEDSVTNQNLMILLNTLKKHPRLKLSIEGHASSKEQRAFPTLSADRAHAIYSLFISQGIDLNRLDFNGEKDKSPVFSNSATGRATLSRRVVFKMILD